MSQTELDGLRLLSFDGGDIRAVSQLIILDDFMRRVEEDGKSTLPILPCDYFHMMGGVGISGIIVILLTVLRMEIDEAIKEFVEIWNLVFADANLDPVARSAKLEMAIQVLLKRRGMEDNQKLSREDQDDSDCKAFLCAIPESNMGMCEKFRSYKSKETATNPTIIEAIRATCAVPALFSPVSVESLKCHVSYVSGAYNYNNPASETIKEACQYFGRSQRVACMLSLGCGQRTTARLSRNNEMTVMSLVNDFASDCEQVDRDLGWRLGDSNVYYRVSVNRVLDSGNEYSSNPIEGVISCTEGFLEHHETAAKMNQCAQASKSIGGVTLRDLSGLNEPRSTSAYGLPSLSEFFVERPGLIKTMAQYVFRGGPSGQRRMVLSGLGGIGKTQITISFLLQFLSRFRHVIFIDGSSVQSIESGLIAKVKSLGATYSRSSASEALEVLANPDYEITRNWAIVYDNVDDPKINIGRYFPSSAFGTIIITTRNPNLGMLAPKAHLKLDVMSEEESVEVLLQSALDPSLVPTEGEREQAKGIAEELGYLPVALVQAGYFIKVHDCMRDYRQRLRKRRPDILGRPAKYQLDAHDGLYSTLNVTWPHLTPGAQSFMSILGFVNYTGFPIILMYRAASYDFLFEPSKLVDRPALFQQTIDLLCSTFRPKGEWNEQDIDDLVAELEEYSLVTRMIMFKVATLRLHPLVHSWTRDRLSKEEQKMFKAAAVRLLMCGTGHDDEDIYEFIYPHITLLSGSLGDIHTNDQAGMAKILAYQGDVEPAIEIWEKIQITIRAIWGPDDLRSGEVDLQLARLYRSSEDEGSGEIASELEAEVIQSRRRQLGADHPKTLEAIVQQALATPIHSSEEHPEEILRGALDLWGKQPTNNWEAIMKTKEALANFCSTKEAISLYTEVLQARMQRNGPDHHATWRVMENLATRYSYHTSDAVLNSVRDESASSMWVSIVAAKISRRGSEHPDTLDAMEHLAWAYAFEGLGDKSLDQWKEVIRLRKAVQGASHKNTLHAMSQLARRYQGQDCFTEAETEWKEVVRLWEETQGPSHEETLYAMTELAQMYQISGRHADAEVRWKEMVQLTTEAWGSSHRNTLVAMINLAKMYSDCERYEDAETILGDAIKQMGENPPLHIDDLIFTSLKAIRSKFGECESGGSDASNMT